MEQWRDIKGYEGLYQVSNEGRVKSVERDMIKTYNGVEYKCHRKEAIKKPHIIRCNGFNRSAHDLWKDNVREQLQTSHLVALAFIPNPNGYTVVHHKDHNPMNNCVENLEWISDDEHRLLHDGEHKKKIYQYSIDGELIKVWESIAECVHSGFDRANISKCCNPKYVHYKTYKGFKWEC